MRAALPLLASLASLASVALGACAEQVGTISLGLATAPESTVLDSATLLRLTVTNPPQVIEAPRTANGFNLVLELEAGGETGELIVEAFDAAGTLVATGQSPPFPVAAINARIVVYMAPPMSIELSPNNLGAPRKEVSASRLSYGAIIAGGADAADAPSSAVALYNAYDHSFVGGMPMPAPRRGITLASNTSTNVYLYGGVGPEGPAGTLWLFDTGVAPNGAYQVLDDQPSIARGGAIALPIGSEHYLVTGAPPLELELGILSTRVDHADLPATGASLVATDGQPTALFAGPAGLVRYREGMFETLSAEPRVGASILALADNRFVVIGGGPAPDMLTQDALVVDAITGVITTLPGALVTARRDAAAAVTPRHLVIAGGVGMDGTPRADAEVLDATTLAPLATIPARPRTAGFAIAFPNDQILFGGGTALGDELELFTPPPP